MLLRTLWVQSPLRVPSNLATALSHGEAPRSEVVCPPRLIHGILGGAGARPHEPTGAALAEPLGARWPAQRRTSCTGIHPEALLLWEDEGLPALGRLGSQNRRSSEARDLPKTAEFWHFTHCKKCTREGNSPEPARRGLGGANRW